MNVDAILSQLGIDQTFFIQLGIFFFIFLTLPSIFFKPFQKLIETRHQKTIEDRHKAEQLVSQAERKFEEYRQKISAEKFKARAEYEKVIAEAKQQEAEIIGHARAEAKKVTQEALDGIQQQAGKLKKSLEADVEGMALQIADILMKK